MLTVNYHRRGAGSPLVLLHGIGHRWQAWRPVLDRLAERHDVIAVDLPGFGGSPALPPGRKYDLHSSMTMLAELFAGLGVDRPHLAGNSLGGLLAVEAAARGLVSSATALAPAGFWTERDRMLALAVLRMLWLGARAPYAVGNVLSGNDRLRARSLAVLYAHPERIDRITAAADTAALRDAPGFNPTMRSGARRGFAWHGTAPRVPLTVAWGDRDRVLPPRQARLAAALLPDARHVTLHDCGHVPMIDDPELVARTILDTCAVASMIPATRTGSGSGSAAPGTTGSGRQAD